VPTRELVGNTTDYRSYIAKFSADESVLRFELIQMSRVLGSEC